MRPGEPGSLENDDECFSDLSVASLFASLLCKNTQSGVPNLGITVGQRLPFVINEFEHAQTPPGKG